MIFSLTLALLATISGALATYLYDEGASLTARLCTGACVGLAALGLVGFVLASFMGLTLASIGVTLALVASPFLLLLDESRRVQVQADLVASSLAIRRALSHPTGPLAGCFLYYAIVSVMLWQVFNRAMIELPDGIYTGLLNNFGDLPFHLSVITGFAYGHNFPPDDPTYAGVRFTYPFLTDFVSAVFVRCGASLRDAMFIENLMLAVSFVGVLHRWAWEMLRDRLASLLTPVLVLLNGGFGFVLLFTAAAKNDEGIVGVLKHIAPSFTVIPDTAWRWGNAISSLLVPQRGMLMGLPLAVIVFTQWWLATGEKKEGETGQRGDGEKGTNDAHTVSSEYSGNAGWGTRKYQDARGGKNKKKRKKGTKAKASRETSDFRIPRSPRGPGPSPVAGSPINRMIAAGIVAGLLPLVHAHSFVVIAVVGGCLALWYQWRAWLTFVMVLLLGRFILTRAAFGMFSETSAEILLGILVVALIMVVWLVLPRPQWRLWFSFFACALVIALPQMWWSTHGSAVNSSSFFSFAFGWDSGKETYFDWKVMGSQFLQARPWLHVAIERSPDVALFWFKNTGLMIPLLAAALLRGGKRSPVSRRLLLFYLPFTLCFIIPNVMTLAPWVWDNIKVLFYWWLASAPLVALLLARLWRAGPLQRALSAGLLACLILAGGLDVASIVTRSGEYQLFDLHGIAFAEMVKQQTEPRALIVHAPVHNDPVFLTGRRSLMGYPGHIWTHGLDFVQRENEIKRIYSGAPDAESLLKRYGVEYAVVGPLERNVMPVNEQFFSRFRKVGEVGGYRLYKIAL